MKNQIYLKITNSNETHHGLKFKRGVIEDPLEWNNNANCEPGGIYFTTPKYICKFLEYGIWLREVTIPDDAKIAHGDNKSKANKLIFGKRRDLRKIKTWEWLVSIGADIHADNDHALRMASQKDYFDIVKYLVEQGADIHAMSDLALRWASQYGHLDVVKYLVSKGANIHADYDQALHWASYNGHLDVVNYLKSIKS